MSSIPAVILSGLALAFVVLAAQAASDKGPNANFEREKVAYIRQYAWPKRVTASEHEVLFTKQGAMRPADQPGQGGVPPLPKVQNAPVVPQPPPQAPPQPPPTQPSGDE